MRATTTAAVATVDDVGDFLNIIFGWFKVPTTRDAMRGESTDRFYAVNGLTRRDYYF